MNVPRRGQLAPAARRRGTVHHHDSGDGSNALWEGLAAMESSSLVHEALGEHIFEWFLRNKRHEWRAYKTHVTAFERDRYLTTL